ncbi:MAG: hypothetical protein MZV64_62540 [Ignavibacteriales bacterium]|nr:hypothetical protein [Ignavibacteriales bacterium]
MSMSQRGNSSFPAGTGVCVVKTFCPRVFLMASSNEIAVFDQFTGAFERQEGGMPFVHVPDRRVGAQAPATCARRRCRAGLPA